MSIDRVRLARAILRADDKEPGIFSDISVDDGAAVLAAAALVREYRALEDADNTKNHDRDGTCSCGAHG